jgi:hypothetical protein
MELEDRYDKQYSHNTVTFYLDSYTPNIEECRFLILKVVEQTVRDFLTLFGSDLTSEQILWHTAVGFIFDNDYRLHWGELEVAPEDLLAVVDVDMEYFRDKMRERFEEKHG